MKYLLLLSLLFTSFACSEEGIQVEGVNQEQEQEQERLEEIQEQEKIEEIEEQEEFEDLQEQVEFREQREAEERAERERWILEERARGYEPTSENYNRVFKGPRKVAPAP